MLQRKQLTKEQALPKIKYYCSYQERSHTEVKEKLYSFGLWKKDVEILMAQLIEENYLNEERFARLFAGGKFRMKQWGKTRIKYELKQRQVSEYCIKLGLKEIGEEDYLATIKKQAEKKWKTLKGEKNIFIKKRKTADYLLRKGFERNMIEDAMAEVGKDEDI
ncbi:MAG: regulatory protein RecX [Flavitalea sp.]